MYTGKLTCNLGHSAEAFGTATGQPPTQTELQIAHSAGAQRMTPDLQSNGLWVQFAHLAKATSAALGSPPRQAEVESGHFAKPRGAASGSPPRQAEV